MSEQNPRFPWNAKIRRTIKAWVDEIGRVSGVPLQVLHIATDENFLSSSAYTEDFASGPFTTQAVHLGSSREFLIKGFSPKGSDDPVLKTTLQLVQNVIKEYMQNQAEIESFSREILDNYQTINTLYRLSEALGNIQDVHRVATIILNQAAVITHAERGSVLLLDKDGRTLHVVASFGFDQGSIPSKSLKVSESLCSEILKSGKPMIVQDIRDRPDLAVYSKGIYKTGSFISIPLQTGGDHEENRLLGVLNLSDKATAESFKSNDLKLLNALTSQASVAIANAQILKELKHSKGELSKTFQELMNTYENLEKRAIIIDQINKISLAINATLDLDRLFDKISLYAKNMTNAAEATVYYKNSPSPVTLQTFDGVTPWEAGHSDGATAEASFFAEILRQGKTLAYNQPGDLIYLPLRGGGKVEIRNLLAVPFFNKGDAVGVIAVANKVSAETFLEEELEILKTLGNQASIAVDNAKLISDQKAQFLATIVALAAAVDAKDPYTHNHSTNVSNYAIAIAKEMFLSEKEIETLRLAAILHDIGKIAIPESILNKPAKLTQEEFEIIKTHPICGVKIVDKIKEMEAIIPGMKSHHERYDGKGYPEGLQGEEIPISARILAVADTYDAITSDRPYRKGPGHAFAEEEIKRCSGSQFAPEVVEAFLKSPMCMRNKQKIVTIL